MTSVLSGAVTGQEKNAPASDEAAIRQRGNDYVAAVRRGDGAAIAAFWTAEGDYVDETGRSVKGRVLASDVEAAPDKGEARRLSVTIESIRFITPEVAVEDGALISPPGALIGSSARRYTAIWVRQKGKWLIDGVREANVRLAAHSDQLQELDWMVGDWISDDDGKTVRLSCRWSDDKNFLLREIDVRLPEREPLHVTQRIGWDAREKQVKSWTFDSEGGHGDGLWFHKQDQWIIEARSILSDGTQATGTNTLTEDGDDAFFWESSNGEIEGEPVTDLKIHMIRTTSKR
ncbi:MAG: YybH family protein [Pirellulales bacterium]